MKFEEAYCTSLNEMLTIDDVTFYYKFNKQFYVDEIKECLICPECRQPNLAYNNAITPYFCTYPNAKHDINCSLRQKEMSSKETEKFISDPNNHALVLRQMDSLLTMLLDHSTTKPNSATNSNNSLNQPQITVTQNTNSTTNKIPRKRIDVDFSKNDFNCDKLFYGSVHLKWEEKKVNNGEEKYYNMLLYRNGKNDKRLVARLKITEKVYNYLPDEYKASQEYDCKIVFLANFYQDSKKSYQKTSIRSSEMILLEKI